MKRQNNTSQYEQQHSHLVQRQFSQTILIATDSRTDDNNKKPVSIIAATILAINQLKATVATIATEIQLPATWIRRPRCNRYETRNIYIVATKDTTVMIAQYNKLNNL